MNKTIKGKENLRTANDQGVGSQTVCYALGDLVRHRASGKKAVVTHVDHRCTKHPAMDLCCMKSDRKECVLVPNGTYSLSYNFEEENNGIDGLLLEKV